MFSPVQNDYSVLYKITKTRFRDENIESRYD